MAKKVLIAINYSDAGTTSAVNYHQNRCLRMVESYLSQLGYEYEIHTGIPSASGTGQFNFVTAALYHFIVTLSHGYENSATDSILKLMDGTQAVTCFNLAMKEPRPTTKDFLGITGTPVSAHYKCTWRGNPVYFQGNSYSNAGGAVVITPLITIDSAPTTFIAWKTKGSVSKVYSSSETNGSAEGIACFPLLLQDAITAGDIAKPSKKVKTYFDIDHYNGSVVSIGDVTDIYTMQQKYNMPISCGLQTGVASGTPEWTNTSAAVKAFIAARTPDKGGLIYPCIHDHEWYWDFAGGSTLTTTTKTHMNTHYTAGIARCEAAGIKMGDINTDAFGYIHMPSNRLNDEALQLMSPLTEYFCSVDNLTLKTGYGIRAVRVTATSTVTTGSLQWSYDFSPNIMESRGIKMLPTKTRFTDGAPHINVTIDSATEITLYSQSFFDWLAFGMMVYTTQHAHNTNFYTNHDGGNAPALRLWNMFGEIANEIIDTHIFSFPGLDY